MAGPKIARVAPAPGGMISPQVPGMVPDFVTIPTHVGESTPAASSKVRPLTQYGSAEALTEVFSRFGDDITQADFEQADASNEETRKVSPANLTPRRPRLPLGDRALEQGTPQIEEISGE